MPLTTSYQQDASKKIVIQNTLTTDKKAIARTVVQENDVQKSRTDYAYDTNGRVISEKDFLDAQAYTEKQFVYGTTAQPEAQATESKIIGVLDKNGELAQGTTGYPMGTLVTKAAYDEQGRIIKQIDANRSETAIAYDAVGRISSVTNPDGSTNTYTYTMPKKDPDIVVHTNELGAKTQYTYDKFGNELSAQDVESGELLYTKRYDSVNHLIEEIHYSSDGEDRKTYYYYDSADRLIEKGTKNASGVVTSRETYSYEYSNGMLKTTKTVVGDQNAPSIVTTSYTDCLGNVVKTGRMVNGKETYDTYTYDYVGNKLTEKTAATYAATPNASYTTKWEYDYNGHVLKTTNAAGDIATSEYDGAGCLIRTADYAANSQTTPYYTT